MMSPSEQKTQLMIYKDKVQRELGILETIENQNNFVMPEDITGPVLYGAWDEYIKSIETAITLNKKYLELINKKLRELE